MKANPMQTNRNKNKGWQAIALAALFAVTAATAYAQDFRTFGGSNERAGRSTLQASTAVPETTWGNGGRGFLRWWDPIFQDGAQIDNPDPAAGATLGAWLDPATAGGNLILAGAFIQNAAGATPYVYSVTSATGGNDGPNPSIGATAAFTWNFTLTPGNEYTVDVNLPIGPTNINPLGAPDLRFTPHYQLYSVTDATGTNYYWADMRIDAGGFANLGNNRHFIADAGGAITVTVYNVCRRNDFGTLVDGTDQPGFDIVYADAAQATNQSPQGVGSYTASPVVGQLLQPRIDAQPTVFDQRVVTARNEEVFVGSLNKQTRFGVITSFTHNGAVVNVAQPLRRNMVWSWPAVRPFDLGQAESDRYAVERQNWITGGPNAAYPRNLVFRQADNYSSGTVVGGLFLPSNAFNSIGPDHLLTPVISTAATSWVDWTPAAKPGKYFVEVFLPNNDTPGDLGTQVTYQIRQGLTVLQTIAIDQSAQSNWVRLPNQPADGYDSTAGPLTIRVLNTGTAQDVLDGRQVYADAVRLVGDADLGITATPVQTVGTVNAPGPVGADVIVATRENGTVTAMEAHGDEVTGTQNNVLWTWPSEDPATDPNNANTEDYGIAETPTGFGMSSPLVANIGGTDLVFTGSQNGRVYALELAGRGDGTTRRRWTWPDDFDTTAPTTPMGTTSVGAINGSVALANVGGTPAIIVPGSNGQIYALDAAGNGGTRKTTVLWQFATTGLTPISMTPVVAFGRVTFAAGNTVYCLDEATGALVWQRNVRQDGITPFGNFGTASPVAVEAPIVAADSLYFVDDGGYITSLDAATGTVNWQEASVASGSTASLRFAYMRTYDPTGSFIQNAVPTVLVASNQGTLLGFYADGSVNINGNRVNWGYFVQSEGTQSASFAVGGWPNAAGLLANRCHLYIGDADGILYAFSSEDDINGVGPITPGVPPGSQSANPNDPNQAALNDLIDQPNVILLSPNDYNDLDSKAVAGTLSAADIANYKANAIQRRSFEFGETLYVMIADINATTVPETSGYVVQYDVTVGSSRTGSQIAQVRDVAGAATPQDGGVAYFRYVVLPTGTRGVAPGTAQLEVSARINRGGGAVRGTPVDLSTSVNTPTGGDFELPNPLGIDLVNQGGTFNQAGVTTNPADVLVKGNLPAGYTGAAATPFNKWTNGFVNPGPAAGTPGTWFSTAVGGTDPVAHNSSGLSLMRVYDRTILQLVNGHSQGLTNVRVQANDLAWQPASVGVPVTAADAGIYNPIAYAGFEDLPNSYPNVSLDYPDMRRSSLAITKSAGGNTENPLFGGVSLNASLITPADLTTYATVAGYEAGLVTRTLQPTVFSMRLNVPQYQPATPNSPTRPSGYVAENVIYVDKGQAGFDTEDAARRFTLGANISVDEHVTSDTKTVDLGSIPAGGGHYNLAGNADQPINGAFAPFNAIFNSGQNPQFQQVTAFNEGNVNLLNVRVSKRLEVLNGIIPTERPLELYASGEHELGWLDATMGLFSDLDPLLSPTFRTGLDPNGNVFLQKPRPGDPAPSRLSTNPRRRQNSNLLVNSGTLIANQAAFPPGDPYVGVAAPIGTPVGTYVRDIFVFEDSVPGSVLGARFPSLGYVPVGGQFVPEAYTNPGITLKFNIRETRLTTRPTAKTSGVFDNVGVGDAGFEWSSRQPTVSRGADGQLYFAFSSNREDVAGAAPSPRPRLSTDGRLQPIWRIYFGSMANQAGITANTSFSPIGDLHDNQPTANKWMDYQGMLPNGIEWNNWFALGAGESLLAPGTPSSASFSYPTFPTAGFVDPLDTPTAGIGRVHRPNRYMAFVGETTKVDRTGTRVPLSQVMVADLQFQAAGVTRNGSGALNGIFPIAQDPTSKKGKPSIVQQGANAAVFYPAQSSGRSELYTATFDGAAWGNVRALGLGAVFEDLSGVSANLRLINSGVFAGIGFIDTFFTGHVRGRQNSEAFYGKLETDDNGMPLADPRWITFQNRLDRLDYDPATGVFWTPGVHFDMSPANVDAFQLLILNPVTGLLEPLINNNPLVPADMRSRLIDREAREMVFESPRGGKVYVDALRGSIRLSGVATSRNTQIFARYSPKFVRVSGASTAFRIGTGEIAQANVSSGMNYRGVSSALDDRYLGVFIDATQPWRNLTEDLNFWYTAIGAPIGTTAVQQDRYFLAFNRTSNDGATAARPAMSTLRFGLYLPTPVAINPNTLQPYALNVTGLATNRIQVDPTSGKVFLGMAEEGRTIRIRYTGIDINGNLLPNIQVEGTVGLIVEEGESLVPIEQVGQEGDFTFGLDRLAPNNSDNRLRRPPLLWMVWSSTRTGAQDVYMQTLAPKTAPRLRRP
ncbi:MAG: PQQ-binding-like beta-propeller repeat protein [Armatimonadetes bacterium]|nr:PQQ-binding-like beta-propeller repeat protein [Armatimonadota bacterium]